MASLAPFCLCQHRGLYLATISLSIITLSTAAIFPQMIRAVIDQGIQSGEESRVTFWVIAMGALVLVQAFATYLKAFLLERGAFE